MKTQHFDDMEQRQCLILVELVLFALVPFGVGSVRIAKHICVRQDVESVPDAFTNLFLLPHRSETLAPSFQDFGLLLLLHHFG